MPRHPMHRHLVMLLVLAIVCAGCSAGSTSPSAPDDSEMPQTPSHTAGISTSEPSPSDTGSGLDERTVAVIEIGGGPDMPVEAFGSVWVLSLDGPLLDDGTVPSVHRIDPETNEVTASVEVPGRKCQGLGASPEAVWVCGPDGVLRIDPKTNAIVEEVPVATPLAVSRLAYGAGTVWAFATTGVAPDSVVRIDPATNQVTATIPLAHTGGTMAFGFDALWVSSTTDDLLLRIDPATNAAEVWTEGIEGAGSVAVGEDAVWVTLLGDSGSTAGPNDATMVRVAPESGEVLAEIATGGSVGNAGGITAAAGQIWVRAGSPSLARIEPATNEVIDRLEARLGGGDVTVAFGSLWATSELGRVIRLTLEP